jgi:ABC-type glycerol-3-phosphate transport system substrate-binding protein
MEVTVTRRPLKNKLRVSFQGAGYFGLLYGTKDVDAAMQWLAFLARTKVQRRMDITLGQLTPCQPALDDPYYGEDWWFKGQIKALPYGRTTQHPNSAWGAITNPKPGAPIYDMMVNALSGRVSVEEAIKTAQEEMQELIRSYK